MAAIEIDQSGKWEAHTHTVIGVGIGNSSYSALITNKSKNAVQGILGKFYQEKNRSKKQLIIRMFTYSVFLSIRDLTRENDSILIDQEYQGNECAIRDLLLYLFRRFTPHCLSPNSIQFGLVGKHCPAHIAAHETFTYGRDPDKILKFEDYAELLDRTEEIRKKAFLKRKQRNESK
ncbi:hypothetical protein J4441_03570 [Candidatus Micrarchaeota archaeon]|nr:hypothetical protein [Candidatus Micrarchaeota archaeon]